MRANSAGRWDAVPTEFLLEQQRRISAVIQFERAAQQQLIIRAAQLVEQLRAAQQQLIISAAQLVEQLRAAQQQLIVSAAQLVEQFIQLVASQKQRPELERGSVIATGYRRMTASRNMKSRIK